MPLELRFKQPEMALEFVRNPDQGQSREDEDEK